MKKIAPEIDSLMWTLAESGNQQAISEFEARFPSMRLELSKRITMVRSLRMNRPESAAPPSIPRFDPSPANRQTTPNSTYLVTGAFVVIALSAFGYTITSNSQHKPPAIGEVSQVNAKEVNIPQPAYANRLPESSNAGSSSAPVPKSFVEPGLPVIPTMQPVAQIPKWEKGQNVTMRGAPLQTVAKLVAAEGGLSLEIAPGMPNPTIDVDYEQVSAANILKDLGRQYAFTPMLSDDGSVILIPAVARSADASLPPIDRG